MTYSIAKVLGNIIPVVITVLSVLIPVIVNVIMKKSEGEKEDTERINESKIENKDRIRQTHDNKSTKRKKLNIILIAIFSILTVATIALRFGFFNAQNIDMPEYKDCKYIGQILNNRPDGYGTLYNSNNCIMYSGHFTNGLYDGRGTIYITKHTNQGVVTLERFSGDFNNGYKEGIIEEYDYWNGKKLIVYSGAYRHDLRNGRGIEYDYDKEGNLIKKTVGFWADGKPNGHTQITKYQSDAIIERYTGNVYDGKFWGIGTLEKNENGNYVMICGSFKDNLPNGECVKYDNQGSIVEQGNYDKGSLISNYPIGNRVPFSKIKEKNEDDLEWSNEYIETPDLSNYTIATIKYTFFIVVTLLLLIGNIVLFLTLVVSKRMNIVFFIFITVIYLSSASVALTFYKNVTVYQTDGKISYSYIGLFDSSMSGIGEYYDKDGNIIKQGNLSDGKLNGFGRKYIYDDETHTLKTFYKGDFKDDYLNGDGSIYTYDELGNLTSLFLGGFSEGKYNGYGVYEHFNIYGFVICRYEGNYYNNQPHGTGILEYIKNDKQLVYCGYFKQGKFDKEGVIYNKLGEVIEQGIYNDDILIEEKEVKEFKFPSDNIWK